MTTDDAGELESGFKDGFAPPRQTGLIGIYLFLAALGMLFVSGMLGYVLVRIRPAFQGTSIRLPSALWISTLLILTSSLTMHRAIRCICAERQGAFRGYLRATLGLALGFVAVQGPSLGKLLSDHAALSRQGLGIYGLIFFLVLLHAMHVLGGIVALVRVNLRARARHYDHERYEGVRYAAIYWHFLDAVWIVMFTIMRVMG